MPFEAPEPRLVFERVVLPDFLGVRILNIGVGEASVDRMLERHEFDVSIRVLRRMDAGRAQIAPAFSLSAARRLHHRAVEVQKWWMHGRRSSRR
jgi:hypothetical protein